MAKRKIVLGVGGSSGSIYAKRLLDKLNLRGDVEIGLVMSSNAHVNWEMEIGDMNLSQYVNTTVYNNIDFFAPFASGSSSFDTMIICPSSMGLLGRIAAGISNDLITRGADVMLKERKRLIIVPRETPLNLIHIKNMELLTQAGAIICPATPSFYSKPKTLEEIADTVVDRVLDLAKLSDPGSYRWQES
jgi:4-hydroxy-3-polyprenylbenzoate decarboxylase